MGRYRYRPLPTEDFVRLATIHPGKWDEDIVISLTCVRFDPENPPYYQALSYVWGSKKHLKVIYVGTSDKAKIRVTRSLKVALQHLRFEDGSRTMWIDTICIDQSNNVEKGPQVAMMGEIFRQANMVIAWLGPERDNSSLALKILGSLSSQIEVNWITYTIAARNNNAQQTLSDPEMALPLGAPELQSISSLLSRRWFRRLWIRQEIYLAKSAVVICGHCRIPFPEFRSAVHRIRVRPGRLIYNVWTPATQLHFQRQLERLDGFLYQSTTVNFRQLRYSFQHAECREPRDRIFAVRSLWARGEEHACPPPDYTRPVSAIYMDLTRRSIELYHDGLDILQQCQLHEKLGGPSWVPDWSVKATIPLASGNTGCRLACKSRTHSSHLLKVLGVRKTIIEEVQQMPDFTSPAMSYIRRRAEALRNLLSLFKPSMKGTPSEAQIQAYAKALIYGNVSQGTKSSPPNTPTLVEITEIVSKFVRSINFNDEEFLPTSPLSRFLAYFKQFCDGRKLVRGSDDHIGNAPPSAEVGDEICVIVGCSAPMVVRRSGNQQFLVVGGCFVDGLSDGEGLLGLLPEYVRPAQFVHSNNRWIRGFEDIRTGEIFYEDPRLRQLPVDLAEYRKTLEREPGARLEVAPEILLEHIPGLKVMELV